MDLARRESRPLEVSVADAYAGKEHVYFANARSDYVEELPPDRSAVLLDVGCGEGATGALARRMDKCGTAYGIELVPQAASVAATVLDDVLVGDCEVLEFPWPKKSIDIVILSEVLEHLRDPWELLRRVQSLLRPSARVFASSPNIAHHRIIRMLLRGRWDLTEFGPMDRTHLRWFTPSSYRRMFEDCGYVVDRVSPVAPLGRKSRLLDAVTVRRLTYLFQTQIDLRARSGAT